MAWNECNTFIFLAKQMLQDRVYNYLSETLSQNVNRTNKESRFLPSVLIYALNAFQITHPFIFSSQAFVHKNTSASSYFLKTYILALISTV